MVISLNNLLATKPTAQTSCKRTASRYARRRFNLVYRRAMRTNRVVIIRAYPSIESRYDRSDLMKSRRYLPLHALTFCHVTFSGSHAMELIERKIEAVERGKWSEDVVFPGHSLPERKLAFSQANKEAEAHRAAFHLCQESLLLCSQRQTNAVSALSLLLALPHL